jgi:hypothetical protein
MYVDIRSVVVQRILERLSFDVGYGVSSGLGDKTIDR